MPYIYILECSDKTYYTGSTWDLDRRFQEHSEGIGSNYTSKRLPVIFKYSLFFDSIKDAFLMEKKIQKWSHAKKKALIENNIEKLKQKAECKNESNSKNFVV
jgi:putative endonuclease